MAGALDHPMLEHGPAGRVGMGGAAVAPSADSLALLRRGRRLQAGGRGVGSLADNLVAIAGMDRPVLVAVEHDGRHHPLLWPRSTGLDRGGGGAILHGGEGEWHVLGSTGGEAGMDA